MKVKIYGIVWKLFICIYVIKHNNFPSRSDCYTKRKFNVLEKSNYCTTYVTEENVNGNGNKTLFLSIGLYGYIL